MLFEIIIFLVVSFGLAYLIDYTVILPLAEHGTNSILVMVALIVRMFTPLIGVLVALYRPGVSIRLLFRWLGVELPSFKWIILAALIPALVYTLSIPLTILIGIPIKYSETYYELVSRGANPLLLYVLLIFAGIIAGMTVNAIVALGEEVGWRGLMHNVLMPRLGLVATAFIVGVTWSLWHAPLIVLLGYNYGSEGGLDKLLYFTFFTISLSLVMHWLREKSESIYTTAVFHGTVNAIAGVYNVFFTVEPHLTTLTPPAGLIPSMLFLITGIMTTIFNKRQ